MKPIKILACLLLLCGALNAADDTLIFIYKDEDGIIRLTPEGKDMSLLTAMELTGVVNRLRTALDDPEFTIRESAGSSLLLINDGEGVANLIKKYHSGDRAAESSFSSASFDGNAAVLPYLIDDVYNGSTEIHGHDDIAGISIRDKSTEMAFASIMKSSLYPSATRAWAEEGWLAYRNSNGASEDRATSQLKAWWEHNKEAVLVKQYAKAIWLPKEKIRQNPSDPTAQAPEKNPAPQPSSLPGSPSSLPWKLIAVALAVLAAGAAALRLRRK